MLSKLSNLNLNLALTLGYLNPALNNSALKTVSFKFCLIKVHLPIIYEKTKGQVPPGPLIRKTKHTSQRGHSYDCYVTVICVPPPSWNLFPQLEKHISLVISIPLPRKHISLAKDMCFPICVCWKGEHILLVICVSRVGEHIQLGICVSLEREHISLVISVSREGNIYD